MDTAAVRRLFRGINERIAALAEPGEQLWLVCECDTIACFRLVEVPPQAFASVCETPGAYVEWPHDAGEHPFVVVTEAPDDEDEAVLAQQHAPRRSVRTPVP